MALAAPMAPAQTLTYEQYLAEGRIEGRYDILEGKRIFMPGPTWRHQEVVGNVLLRLHEFGRAQGVGKAMTAPFDVLVRLTPRLQTRQPDVFFITNARLQEAGMEPEEGVLTVAPELVVEVLSPSEGRRTRTDKIADFQSIGVRECWIVSPQAETVEVLRLAPDALETVGVYVNGQTLRSEVFPDLSLPVVEIFAE